MREQAQSEKATPLSETSGRSFPTPSRPLPRGPRLVNYPDSAQAVASFQYNKHFLIIFSQKSSQWARVTLPAGGREETQSSDSSRLNGRSCSHLQKPGSPGYDEARRLKGPTCCLCSPLLIWHVPSAPKPFSWWHHADPLPPLFSQG